MKTKQLFLFAALVAMFAACSPIEEPIDKTGNEQQQENQTPENQTTEGNYVGTVIVEGGYMADDGTTTDFVQDKVSVSITTNEDNTFNIVMYQVQFSNRMPTAIDMEIPKVDIENGTISGNEIVPNALLPTGAMPYERYLVTDLKGNTTFSEQGEPETLSFSLKFGQYPTSFRGVLSKAE